MPRILIVPVMCAALGFAAETPPPASERFLEALAGAPAIAAARSRVAAADSAQAYADVLPDPMLGADIGRERPRMGDDMLMYGAMVEQSLPRWGEREAMRLGARARLGQAEAGFAATVGEHAAAIATAVAEAEAAGETLVLVRETRERIEALRGIMRVRIAAGTAMIGEQLALDTRAQQLDLQISDLERRQGDALAEARGRLGLAPDAPLPPFAAPDPAAIRVEANPMARSAAAMRLEAEAMEREALSRGNPETAVGLAWERESAGTEEQSDKLSLTFRMSLPIHRSAYRNAADAARDQARAARHEASGATWMARSQVGRAQRSIAQAARAQAAADDVAARTRTEYDALIRQVGSGGASVAATLDLLDMVAESAMSAIMARLDSRMAAAELWRLAPPTLPAGREHDADHHQPQAATP